MAMGLLMRCFFCSAPCDGTLHDHYGEYVMRRDDLIVCDTCDEDFQHESGPWDEVR